MSEDVIATVIVGVVVTLHVLGLAWWRGLVPPLLNATVAAAVLAWNAPRLDRVLAPPMDQAILWLMGVEMVILLAAILAVRGADWAGGVSRLAYVAHLMLGALVLGFMLTFEMEWLF